MKSRNGKPRRERIKEIKEKEDRREKEKKELQYGAKCHKVWYFR